MAAVDNTPLLRTHREALRLELLSYEQALVHHLDHLPRGSGHAENEFDQIKASITEVRSAKRVLWMEGS